MVAVIMGLIFLGQQLTQVGVMNINGAIFLFLTNMTFQNAFATITVSSISHIFSFVPKSTSYLSGFHIRTACVHA